MAFSMSQRYRQKAGQVLFSKGSATFSPTQPYVQIANSTGTSPLNPNRDYPNSQIDRGPMPLVCQSARLIQNWLFSKEFYAQTQTLVHQRK